MDTLCSLLGSKASPSAKKEAAEKSQASKKEEGGTPENGKEGSDEGENKKSEDRSNEEEDDEEGDSSGDEDEEEDQPLVSLLSFLSNTRVGKDIASVSMALPSAHPSGHIKRFENEGLARSC